MYFVLYIMSYLYTRLPRESRSVPRGGAVRKYSRGQIDQINNPTGHPQKVLKSRRLRGYFAPLSIMMVKGSSFGG